MQFEERELRRILDAFCNDALIQALAHADYGTDNCSITTQGPIDRPDEGLINLEHIDRELVQVAQAGVASAKVIHGDLHAGRLELCQQFGTGRSLPSIQPPE